MSDDMQEPGPDTTGETTASSSSAKGPLSSELAETLRLIEQKREAGQAEREQRGITWRATARRSHEPGEPRPPTPLRPRPEAPRVACEACHDQGYLGYTWNARPCTCSAGERWHQEQEAKREALRLEEEAYRQAWEREQRLALLEHLDKAYRGWDKDTYPKQGNQKALRRVLDYVEAGTNPQRGLGLVGPVGCGKTSLLVTAYKLVAPRLARVPCGAGHHHPVCLGARYVRPSFGAASTRTGARGTRATGSSISVLPRRACSSWMTWEPNVQPNGHRNN